jgi:uncharacterized delta-60 repeat protein
MLDTAWGDGGFAELNGTAFLSVPQPDGKVLTLQRAPDWTSLRLARFLPTGDLDPSFGTDGVGAKLTLDAAAVKQAMVQTDGKIIVTGGDYNGMFLARFNADGTIDTGFGNDGLANLANAPEKAYGAGARDPIGGLALQGDGKILAAGRVNRKDAEGKTEFGAIFRFSTDGTLDATFGEKGRALLPIEKVFPTALTVLESGKIFYTANNMLGRLNINGSNDLTFSGDGMTTIDLPMGNDEFQAVRELSDSKILLAGGTYDWVDANTWTSSGVPVIARVDADGALDTTFGDDGLYTAHLAQSVGNSDMLTALAVDGSGNIFASGTRTNGTFRLYAVTADGDPNTEFSPDGLVQNTQRFNAANVSIDSEGSVFVSGGGANSGLVARVAEVIPVELIDGVLFVRGTSEADSISLESKNGKISLSLNNQITEYDPADVLSLDISTFGGNDVIAVSLAKDATIRPGAGNDSVTSSTGNDRILEESSNSGRDTIRSSDGNDTISSGDGNDRVVAGSSNMAITTGDGDDNVTVGDGRMSIDTGNGDDTILTGNNDWSIINAGQGNDNITTFGSVSIQAGGAYFSVTTTPGVDDDVVNATGGRIRVDLGGGNNFCTVASRFRASIGGSPGNDSIVTGSGDDHIDPLAGNDTVYSNGGKDYISQSFDSDFIDLGSGNDTVESGNRGTSINPTIYAGSGDDVIYARGGGKVFGGSGNDNISAERFSSLPVNTLIVLEAHGQAGNDTIIGSDGRDKLYGGDGDDWLRGGMSADKLFGGAGNDKLSGNGGADILLGDVGSDTLFGNLGADKLFAQDGEVDHINSDPADQVESDQIDLLG